LGLEGVTFRGEIDFGGIKEQIIGRRETRSKEIQREAMQALHKMGAPPP